MEVWWVHNPQVLGSKLGSDIKLMWVCLKWLSRAVLGIPNNKWESISIDFNVSLPLAQRRINVIWVVVHSLRKLQ